MSEAFIPRKYWLERPLKVLMIEDDMTTTALNAEIIRSEGIEIDYKVVANREDLLAALEKTRWDLIISDYEMPDFNGMEALTIYLEQKSSAPFIVVSGKIGEEKAVDMMKLGARDYILKGNMVRFMPVILRELHDAEERRIKELLDEIFQKSEKRYRSIFDYVPIGIFFCMADGSFLDVNPTFLEILGYKSFDALTKEGACLQMHYDSDFKDKNNKNEDLININKVFEERNQREAHFFKKDKTACLINFNSWLFQYDKDNSLVIGTIEDITEQRRIELELVKMKKLHESIMNFASDL